MDRQTHQPGFTLLELSIVLVIIAVLAGGILVGQDLMNAARVQKTITDTQKILAAVNQFQNMYNCLPGDCPNASSFNLNAVPASVITLYEASSPALASNDTTLDGNGNHRIDQMFPILTGGHTDCYGVPCHHNDPLIYEQLGFWMHLNNAALLTGQIANDGAANSLFVHWLMGEINYGTDGSFTDAYQKNWLMVGLYSNPSDTSDDSPQLTPSAAYAIDNKIDDGLPQSGKILAGGPAQGNDFIDHLTFGSAGGTNACAVNTTTPVQYNVTVNQPYLCMLAVPLQ